MNGKEIDWSPRLDGDLFNLTVRNEVLFGCHWRCPTVPLFVLIFIHGLNSNLELNANFLRVFPKYNFAVIGTDHAGCGYSTGKTTTIPDIIDEVTELIKYARSIYPNLPIYLLGHSMGGLSILKMAVDKNKILEDVNGLIAHAPWISTNNNKEPGFLLSIIIKILAIVYPSYQINTGLNVSKSSYFKEYKEMALSTKHLQSTMAIKLVSSVFSAINVVKKKKEQYMDIPLLFLQGLKDDCVVPEENIKWVKSLQEIKGNLITIKTFENGLHDLFKYTSRQGAFEEINKFVNATSQRKKLLHSNPANENHEL